VSHAGEAPSRSRAAAWAARWRPQGSQGTSGPPRSRAPDHAHVPTRAPTQNTGYRARTHALHMHPPNTHARRSRRANAKQPTHPKPCTAPTTTTSHGPRGCGGRAQGSVQEPGPNPTLMHLAGVGHGEGHGGRRRGRHGTGHGQARVRKGGVGQAVAKGPQGRRVLRVVPPGNSQTKREGGGNGERKRSGCQHTAVRPKRSSSQGGSTPTNRTGSRSSGPQTGWRWGRSRRSVPCRGSSANHGGR
jgi:hypothetical protein